MANDRRNLELKRGDLIFLPCEVVDTSTAHLQVAIPGHGHMHRAIGPIVVLADDVYRANAGDPPPEIPPGPPGVTEGDDDPGQKDPQTPPPEIPPGPPGD